MKAGAVQKAPKWPEFETRDFTRFGDPEVEHQHSPDVLCLRQLVRRIAVNTRTSI